MARHGTPSTLTDAQGVPSGRAGGEGCRYMIRYELAGMGLASLRFAVSPLHELVLSLRAWVDPDRYPTNRPWLQELRAQRSALDNAMLLALTNDRRWTPDFLTPPPRRTVG